MWGAVEAQGGCGPAQRPQQDVVGDFDVLVPAAGAVGVGAGVGVDAAQRLVGFVAVAVHEVEGGCGVDAADVAVSGLAVAALEDCVVEHDGGRFASVVHLCAHHRHDPEAVDVVDVGGVDGTVVGGGVRCVADLRADLLQQL